MMHSVNRALARSRFR